MRKSGQGILFIAFAAFGSQTAYGAATVDISAYIIETIMIETQGELSFGEIAPGSTAGIVTLSPDGTLTDDGNTRAYRGSQSTAMVIIEQANPNMALELSFDQESVTINANSSSMTVNNFVFSCPGMANAPTVQGRKAELDKCRVGASLEVSAYQSPGLYSGAVSISANYE